MASIYSRPDSQKLWISFYPRPGAKLVRFGLGSEDRGYAEKVARKVELLVELEKMANIELPTKIFGEFESLPSTTPQPKRERDEKVGTAGCDINEVIRAFLVRSTVTVSEHATADKISRLRQFFGTARINALDPRPPEKLKHGRKSKVIEPWFKGVELKEVTTNRILEFFASKDYKNSSKRHFRELFHELFLTALKSGMYRPDNPYCANPADDLPGFTERDEPIAVLNAAEVAEQYRTVVSDPLISFGCHLMIEGGFRLHEILALRQADLYHPGKVRLIIPGKQGASGTKLKTGERPVTVLPTLRPVIERFLASQDRNERAWCFPSPAGLRMTSDAFGERLRQLNRKADLSWTTQDFRHTFATNRIAEGWNLKTLAQEMGTSIAMLQKHYAAFIDPPVLAAISTSSS